MAHNRADNSRDTGNCIYKTKVSAGNAASWSRQLTGNIGSSHEYAMILFHPSWSLYRPSLSIGEVVWLSWHIHVLLRGTLCTLSLESSHVRLTASLAPCTLCSRPNAMDEIPFRAHQCHSLIYRGGQYRASNNTSCIWWGESHAAFTAHFWGK